MRRIRRWLLLLLVGVPLLGSCPWSVRINHHPPERVAYRLAPRAGGVASGDTGRRFQSGEGWHSSENPVCFWNP